MAQIEKRVHHVLQGIHQLPDLEELAEEGLEKRLETWHSLGAIDEDEILRRMELHMDELPDNMTEEDNRTVVLELIEKRRRRIMEQLRRENPDVLEKPQGQQGQAGAPSGKAEPGGSKKAA